MQDFLAPELRALKERVEALRERGKLRTLPECAAWSW
jgi:hypothetical protein